MTAAIAVVSVAAGIWWAAQPSFHQALWHALPGSETGAMSGVLSESGQPTGGVVNSWPLRVAALLMVFVGALRLGCAVWSAAAVTLALAFSASFLGWSMMVPGTLEAGTPVGRLVELAGRLAADLGIPGTVLLGVGFLTLTARLRSVVFLMGWTVVACVWALVASGPDRWAPVVLASIPAWWVVAVGIQSLSAYAHSRAKRGVMVLVLALPVMSLGAHASSVAQVRGASAFVDQYLDRLATMVPADAVVVTEGGLIDQRLMVHHAWQGTRAVRRVPRDPARIAAALREGRTVVAFAGARRHLRELGFRVQTLDSVGVPMSIPELLATVPTGWIVALAATPQFALTVRPDSGPTFAALGGTQNLFGQFRWHYGLVGVKGQAGGAIERGSVTDIDAVVKAGEPLSSRVRAPAAIAVRTVGGRAVVEHRGVTVASSATGIALVVVSPSGTLEAAYAPEFDRGVRILVDPPSLRAGLVTGREPCVDLVSATWSDVSAAARLASLGSVLEPGQSVTMYFGADHPLTPRPAVLDGADLVVPAVERFDAVDSGNGEALRGRMSSDGLGGESQRVLTTHRHVYRVDTTADPTGRRVLALRLGGLVSVAFARLSTSAVDHPVGVCTAMRREIDSSDLDLERDDLFLHGWAGVERAEQKPFRWTRAPRAQVVLPLRRPGPRVVSINATPLDGADMMVTLWVNGTPLGSVPAEASLHEYRWTVPATYWRVGMNSMRVGVSKLARPKDFGITDDDRLLGLAVERIRVRPVSETESRDPAAARRQ